MDHVDLHGMEPWLLREALKVLEAEGKVRCWKENIG